MYSNICRCRFDNFSSADYSAESADFSAESANFVAIS